MKTKSKKSLAQLGDVIKKDYGILLDQSQLSELADKLSRLTLLAKKHRAKRILAKEIHLLTSDS